MLALILISLFSPPEGWEPSKDPKQIAFIGKREKGVAPSLNLMQEKTPLSLEAYVSRVKEKHSAHPQRKVRDLGNFDKGHILEIETKESWQELVVVQYFMLREDTCYILTGSCLKAERGRWYPAFLKSFKTLQ